MQKAASNYHRKHFQGQAKDKSSLRKISFPDDRNVNSGGPRASSQRELFRYMELS